MKKIRLANSLFLWIGLSLLMLSCEKNQDDIQQTESDFLINYLLQSNRWQVNYLNQPSILHFYQEGFIGGAYEDELPLGIYEVVNESNEWVIKVQMLNEPKVLTGNWKLIKQKEVVEFITLNPQRANPKKITLKPFKTDF